MWSHYGANQQIAGALKVDELLTRLSSTKFACHRNQPDLSDSFKEWPFANITTKQIYECILISPVLQSISVSRWDSFEIDIPGKPGGAGQHVQGDHDDQQGHHGATGACGDEQNQNLDCADFADSKVSSIWLILIDIDHKGLIQSNPKERIRGLAEKLNGENQQLQVCTYYD